MASQETTSPPKPFQYGLQSIFMATAAVAGAFGVWHWAGEASFILTVQLSAVIAVLVKSKGTAWPGVVLGGLLVLMVILLLQLGVRTSVFLWSFWGSLAAYLGGGLAANAETKKHSRFLRWTPLIVLAWFLFLFGVFLFQTRRY